MEAEVRKPPPLKEGTVVVMADAGTVVDIEVGIVSIAVDTAVNMDLGTVVGIVDVLNIDKNSGTTPFL